jgi:CubicO group peptidase (beta-lactamase class C family)
MIRAMGPTDPRSATHPEDHVRTQTIAPLLLMALALSGPAASRAAEPGAPSAPPEPAATPADDAIKARCAAAADYSASCAGRVLLVMIDGKVVFERADNGWTLDKMHPLASGSKSFVGAVAAAAVQDGLFTWDEPAADTIPEWKSDPRKSRITVRQLLSLSSGLDPSDALLGGRGGGRILGQGAADRAKRLGPEKEVPDFFKAAIDVPAVAEPGAAFAYGPSHFYAFGELLQRKLAARHAADPSFPDTTFWSYMKRRVLDPIGLSVGHWVKDAAGNPALPGGALLTAREWAKFGQLVLDHGQRRGPDGTMTPVIAWEQFQELFKPSKANPNYGLTWWLPTDANPEATLVADGPAGDGPGSKLRERVRERLRQRQMGPIAGPDGKPLTVYMAAGLGKQRLIVIPSERMVIVRFAEATLAGQRYQDRELIGRILGGAKAAESKGDEPAKGG